LAASSFSAAFYLGLALSPPLPGPLDSPRPLYRAFSLGLALSTIAAVTAGAVVGDVEPRAIEDDGWGRKHTPYLAVTVRALLQRRVAEMLAALKMQPTGQTFLFVHGHDDTPPCARLNG
jgi:hypothetical protein